MITLESDFADSEAKETKMVIRSLTPCVKGKTLCSRNSSANLAELHTLNRLNPKLTQFGSGHFRLRNFGLFLSPLMMILY